MNRCELSSSVLLSSRDFSSQPEMEARVVGDYVVGPERIGTGSFAVVWKGRHLHEGNEVAVKEIDKTKLSTKVKESLMKEITILRQVSHPNIVKLHHALQTDDKLYLMLEYCTGGDLAAYLHRHGRVSETVARHFMRQLALGLLVLRENNLIHRDLKPQNLLLCTRDETPVLKIGDFGFARYLMPHGLADTLCGSPLYMAPEIIQNRKYDAKADLWSVGAILFQLVTGRPPFEGNTQFQLFQNILTSDELQFPQDVAAYLNPDCIDLCRRLLRRNPVERLAFEDFFNHSFLAMPRCIGSALEFSPTSSNENIKVPCGKSSDLANSENTKKSDTKELFSRTGDSNVSDSIRFINDNANENFSSSVGGPSKSENSKCLEDGVRNQDLLRKTAPKIDDSVESIARGYVLVHAHSASMETLALSLEASSGESSPAKFLSYTQKKSEVPTTLILMQGGESATGSACCAKSIGSQMSSASTGSGTSASKHVTGSASANPSIRLKVLYQYLQTLSELAQEKLNAEPHLDSLSVELVALAVWKETFRLCNSWIPNPTGGDPLNSFLPSDDYSHQADGLFPLNSSHGIDFKSPSSVCSWIQQGFVLACDRAEKIANSLRGTDGDRVMPDAMEIIYQTALSAGKNGAVDELLGHRERAVASYRKAITLFTFVLAEAPSLPLNPPFVLSPADKLRIQRYITNIRAHLIQCQIAEAESKMEQISQRKWWTSQ